MNIIEDVNLLRQKSEAIDHKSDECRTIIQRLIHNIPNGAVGLSAPQISEFKRMFAANLSNGRFVFVNPSLKLGNKIVSSVERCLSIPGVVRNLKRSNKVTIQADYAVKWDYLGGHPTVMKDIDYSMKLHKQDAFIVQHEYDHLDGILILDRPVIEELKAAPVQQKVVSQSKKERLKKKRQATKARRREEKRVEIQEHFIAKKFGLFDT